MCVCVHTQVSLLLSILFTRFHFTHIHTCTYMCTHTRNTHTHIYTQIHTHVLVYLYTLAHMHVHTTVHTHTHTLTHTHKYTCTYTHTSAHAQIHRYDMRINVAIRLAI